MRDRERHIESTAKRTVHIPVLLRETVALLGLRPGMSVIDATLGGGGHTRALLAAVGKHGHVLAIDTDSDAVKRFESLIGEDQELSRAYESKALRVARGNFSKIRDIASLEGIEAADAIIADLGFSSDQVADGERGLSFEHEGSLDMRLDRSQSRTAAEIVNREPMAALERMLREYGDEPFARDIARRIERDRKLIPFATTTELAAAIRSSLPAAERRRRGKHPEAQAFQALRIAVNDELGALQTFLDGAFSLLAPGGTLAVISFHSGEDRIVKRFLAARERGCICPPSFPKCVCGRKAELTVLTKKPVTPGPAELKHNPRSRSARLRAGRKQ